MMLSARFILKALERIAVGELYLRLPDGSTRSFGSGAPRAELHVADWRFFRRILLDGDLGLAEAYMRASANRPTCPR